MNSNFKFWIANKYATSWQLALALFINYPLTGFLLTPESGAATEPSSNLINLVAGAVAATPILIFYLLQKVFKSQGAIWFSFLAWSVTAIAISTMPNALVKITYSNYAPAFELDLFISGTLQAFVIQLVYTMIITGIAETRSQMKSLLKKQAQLRFARATYTNQIEEISARISEMAKESVSKLLAALQQAIASKSASDRTKIAGQIRDAIDSIIRPLSWNIEKQELPEPSFEKIKLPRVTLRDRFGFKVSFSRVANIPLLTLYFLFFDIPVAYFVFGYSGALECAIAILVIITGLAAFKRIFGERKLAAWLVVTAVTVLSAFLGASLLLIRAITGELVTGENELAFVFSFAQITALNSIFFAAIQRRFEAIEVQREVTNELETVISSLRQAAWVAKKRMSRLVHGPVQSELFAAQMALSAADSPESETYERVIARIQAVNDLLTAETKPSQPFSQVLASIVSTWLGALEIQTDLDAGAMAAVEGDQVASACAIEVIREAVSNAAKYGSSPDATLQIQKIGDKRIHIKVTNPTDAATISQAGYGSQILDEVSHEWHFGIENGRATLVAEVVLS